MHNIECFKNNYFNFNGNIISKFLSLNFVFGNHKSSQCHSNKILGMRDEDI